MQKLVAILGTGAVATLIAIAAFMWSVHSSRSADAAVATQISAQLTQLAKLDQQLGKQDQQIEKQNEQIDLMNEQNRLLAERAAIEAQQAGVDKELLTPLPTDDSGAISTKIVLAVKATQIEVTKQAIVAKQEGINATQTSISQSLLASNSGFTESDIDRLIQSGNWHCMDGFPRAISINKIPANFIVQSPFTRVDTNRKFYSVGETVLENGLATGWLEGNLPNNNCSLTQLKVTQSDINALLGNGNWYCLTQYPTGVKVNSVPSNFVVKSPSMFVDKNDIRYYKGEMVPSGGPATVWFPNEIPTSDCP